MLTRPLAPDDAEAAAALIRSAFAVQAVPTDPPSSALRETGSTVQAWIEGGGGFGIVGAGGLSAVLLWAERDGGLYAGRLAVAPEARGQGLARRLVGAAEAEARRRGLPRVHVRVRLELPGNLALFASLGFREVGREAHPGFAVPTVAVLEKRLDGGVAEGRRGRPVRAGPTP